MNLVQNSNILFSSFFNLIITNALVIIVPYTIFYNFSVALLPPVNVYITNQTSENIYINYYQEICIIPRDQQ